MQKLENMDFVILYYLVLSCLRLLEQETQLYPDSFYLIRYRNHAIEIIVRGHELTLIINTTIFHRARDKRHISLIVLFTFAFLHGYISQRKNRYLQSVSIFYRLIRYRIVIVPIRFSMANALSDHCYILLLLFPVMNFLRLRFCVIVHIRLAI